MKIQIDGASTFNKGGELMLQAVLQGIESHNPHHVVFWNTKLGANQPSYLNSTLKIEVPLLVKAASKTLQNLKLEGACKKLGLPYTWLTPLNLPTSRNIDLILDSRGFTFSDKLVDQALSDFSNYFDKIYARQIKLILLPQAFGPFHSAASKRLVTAMSRAASIIYARDPVSRDHLIDGGCNPDVIRLAPDFTSLVQPKVVELPFTPQDKVCIIPNWRMIQDTRLSKEEYLGILVKIIKDCRSQNRDCFLLNHETNKDLKLCEEIQKLLTQPIRIVSGFSAQEIKGIIGQSYAVITGRYHGVANALNTGVPSLATSWSHKYEYLYKEFCVDNSILDLTKDWATVRSQIQQVVNLDSNNTMRAHLRESKKVVSKLNKAMWQDIWLSLGHETENDTE